MSRPPKNKHNEKSATPLDDGSERKAVTIRSMGRTTTMVHTNCAARRKYLQVGEMPNLSGRPGLRSRRWREVGSPDADEGK